MLIFRPYKNCDAAIILNWVSDEKTFFQWTAGMMGEFPLTPENINAFYEKEKDNPRYFIFTACDEKGIPVGHMIMRYLNTEGRKLRFGFVIVDDKLRGKGYGKKLLQLAIKYAFDFLHIEEITLGVFANNDNAFHCYTSVGFQEYGERTSYSIKGTEWECIEMKYTC